MEEAPATGANYDPGPLRYEILFQRAQAALAVAVDRRNILWGAVVVDDRRARGPQLLLEALAITRGPWLLLEALSDYWSLPA